MGRKQLFMFYGVRRHSAVARVMSICILDDGRMIGCPSHMMVDYRMANESQHLRSTKPFSTFRTFPFSLSSWFLAMEGSL